MVGSQQLFLTKICRLLRQIILEEINKYSRNVPKIAYLHLYNISVILIILWSNQFVLKIQSLLRMINYDCESPAFGTAPGLWTPKARLRGFFKICVVEGLLALAKVHLFVYSWAWSSCSCNMVCSCTAVKVVVTIMVVGHPVLGIAEAGWFWMRRVKFQITRHKML